MQRCAFNINSKTHCLQLQITRILQNNMTRKWSCLVHAQTLNKSEPSLLLQANLHRTRRMLQFSEALQLQVIYLHWRDGILWRQSDMLKLYSSLVTCCAHRSKRMPDFIHICMRVHLGPNDFLFLIFFCTSQSASDDTNMPQLELKCPLNASSITFVPPMPCSLYLPQLKLRQCHAQRRFSPEGSIGLCYCLIACGRFKAVE